MLGFSTNKMITACLVVAGVFATGLSCSKYASDGKGTGLTEMPLQKPANFPPFVYDTAQNHLTKEGFELGRRLFYEVKLSRDNTISCGFCHIQTSAFTQHGHSVSHGINDRLGTRNSPPTFNLAWSGIFMWDGGIFNLDLQPLAPIKNHVEMDEDIQNVVAKLKADPLYPDQFRKVFGPGDITASNMLKAMSQFMIQCVSANSKYDLYKRKEGATLTADELAGMNLVQEKCSACHSTDLFTDNGFHNNGLPPSVLDDKGRNMVTLNPADEYKFKTPTLRNLKFSAPYMHDGRFLSLAAVLDHYNKGVQESATLDPLLRKNGQTGIPLTEEEKNKILAFLNTLNDETFVRDPKFSEQ